MRQMSKTRSLPIAPHDPYAAFRFSNYRYYTLGSFFSVIGQQMIRVAVGYEIYHRTHSAFDLGLIGLFIWIPILLFMLPAGAVSDHFNRKIIVACCSLLYALGAVGLALSPRFLFPLPLMYALLFLTGLTRAFNDPARQSLLPNWYPEPTSPTPSHGTAIFSRLPAFWAPPWEASSTRPSVFQKFATRRGCWKLFFF